MCSDVLKLVLVAVAVRARSSIRPLARSVPGSAGLAVPPSVRLSLRPAVDVPIDFSSRPWFHVFLRAWSWFLKIRSVLSPQFPFPFAAGPSPVVPSVRWSPFSQSLPVSFYHLFLTSSTFSQTAKLRRMEKRWEK